MSEQTEVERLTKEKAKINADLAAATELECQQKNLLPKLKAKRTRLNARLAPLQEEQTRLSRAIADIEAGVPLPPGQLRKPRAKKSAEGEE